MLTQKRASLFSFASTTTVNADATNTSIVANSQIVPPGYHWIVKNWNAALLFMGAALPAPSDMSGLYLAPTGLFSVDQFPVNLGDYVKVPLNDLSLGLSEDVPNNYYLCKWLQLTREMG